MKNIFLLLLFLNFGSTIIALHDEQLLAKDTLDLSKQGFTAIPKYVFALTSLRTLNLGDNEITDIPHEISELTHLQELKLYGNQLRSFPESLLRLTRLKKINLFGNQINELPDDICKLTNLSELNLRANKLSNLPANFSTLPLKKLNLSANKFREIIPDHLPNSLEYLDVTDNHETAISLACRKFKEKLAQTEDISQLDFHVNLSGNRNDLESVVIPLRSFISRDEELKKTITEELICKLPYNVLISGYSEYMDQTILPLVVQRLSKLTNLREGKGLSSDAFGTAAWLQARKLLPAGFV